MPRTRQLACLLVLLTVFGAAGVSAAPAGVSMTRMEAILFRGCKTFEVECSQGCDLATAAFAGSGTTAAVPLGPRPSGTAPAAHLPAAQAAFVHATTSFLRA